MIYILFHLRMFYYYLQPSNTLLSAAARIEYWRSQSFRVTENFFFPLISQIYPFLPTKPYFY